MPSHSLMAHTSQPEPLSGSMGPSKSRLVVNSQDPLLKSEQRAIDMRKTNKQHKLATKRQNIKAQAIDNEQEESKDDRYELC